MLEEPNDGILPFRYALPEEEVTKQRNQRQGKNQRTDQGGRHGPRHRRKNPSFMTLQREDRNVGRDDDQHREKRRASDLSRGIQNEFFQGAQVAFESRLM